jgi:hypothetical protein
MDDFKAHGWPVKNGFPWLTFDAILGSSISSKLLIGAKELEIFFWMVCLVVYVASFLDSVTLSIAAKALETSGFAAGLDSLPVSFGGWSTSSKLLRGAYEKADEDFFWTGGLPA